jgi:hypothetical protein
MIALSSIQSAFGFFNLVSAEIACFADTPGIEFAISVFTVESQFDPAPRVIAVAAEALRVVQGCRVLAFCDSRDAFLVGGSFLLLLFDDYWRIYYLLLIATHFTVVLNGLIGLGELRFLDGFKLVFCLRGLVLCGVLVSELIRLVKEFCD